MVVLMWIVVIGVDGFMGCYVVEVLVVCGGEFVLLMADIIDVVVIEVEVVLVMFDGLLYLVVIVFVGVSDWCSFY